MFRANYDAFAQQANDGLVAIRNLEIAYFTQFFTSFGIQAALIAGFQLASISQVYILYELKTDAFQYCYWTFTACSICTSVHVLLCSVYIVTFGQGLALRGPTGSMIRALDGLVEEQQHILLAFQWNMIFLVLSTIWTYYVVMEINGAVICTVLTLVEMSTVWDRSPASGRGKKHNSLGLNEVTPNKRITKKQNFRKYFGFRTREHVVFSGSRKLNTNLQLVSVDFTPVDLAQGVRVNDDLKNQRSGAGYELDNIRYQGYLTVLKSYNEGVTWQKVFSRADSAASWVRRYVVISGNLCILYKDRESYLDDPEQEALTNRPFHLNDYYLMGNKQSAQHSQFSMYLALKGDTAKFMDDAVSETSSIHSSSTSMSTKTLPRFRGMEFRCDTENELNAWMTAFTQVVARPPREFIERFQSFSSGSGSHSRHLSESTNEEL